MKHILATTAIALTMTAPAFADEHAKAEMEGEMHSGAFIESVKGGMKATDFIGMRLYVTENDVSTDPMAELDENWDDVGEIADLILDREGNTDAVLIDIGGFLGLGERRVAVTLDQINMVPDADDEGDYFLVLKGTKAEMENAPTFVDREALLEERTAREENMAEAEATEVSDEVAEATAEVEGEKAEGAEEMADAEAPAEMKEEQAEAKAEVAEEKAEGAEEVAEAAGDTTPPESEAEMTAAEAPADEAGEAGANVATAEEAADPVADASGEAAAIDTDIAEEGADAGVADAKAEMIEFSALTAEQLTGHSVTDAEGENVGEISDLVLENEMISKVIVDVGGFLGIGEKPIAIEPGMLEVTKAEGENITIRVKATEEELEALPRFEKE